MAEESKTDAELIILLADNAGGDISEQDIRNLLESIFQYGGVCMPASATPTAGQSIGTSYEKITQFTADTLSSSGLTPAHASDNITVVKGGKFIVFIGLSFSGSNNSTWVGSLFVDDVDQDMANFERKLSTAGDVGKIGSVGIVEVADGEVVDYRVKADNAAKTIIVRNGALVLFRVG